MTYKVSQELLEALVGYLATRPWREVHAFILELQKVEPFKEVTRDTDTPAEVK